MTRLTRRRLLILLALVATTLAGGAAAWAFWTAPGSGTASAASGSLGAPTDVAVPATSSGTVHVTWSGSTLSTGEAATGYYVTRVRNGDSATSPACGTSPSALTASAVCDDENVASGGYHYMVTAAYHSWTAASDPSNTVTVTTDTTPPAVTPAFPQNGTTYTASGWTGGCPATGICGTASDASGVQSVAVSVRQGSTGLYWGGSSFNQAAETFFAATGTTSWSLPMARPADGSYTVHVRATDGAGNTTPAGSYASATFTVDATGPTGGSVSYADGYYTALSVPVTVSSGTDPGSGVDAGSASLLRASAPLSNGGCGTYGSFSAVTLAGGADTTVVSDRCYSYQYTVSDNAGNPTTYTSASIAKIDTTAPTNALSLGATSTGAYLSGSTLFYKGGATGSGSFTLVDTVSDSGSGAASATFPAVTASGWTHNAETVTTPAGGPYASGAFTWNTSAATPSAYTVTSRNAAGATTNPATTLSFVSDTTAPSGGSISYTNGAYSSLSVPITLTSGTDAGSGINAASGLVQRATAPLAGGGTCGTFGAFAPVTLFGGADTSVVNGSCYKYQYVVSDNVGNQAAPYTSASVARVDISVTVSAVALTNGGSTIGKAEESDTLAIQYSRQMDATKLCSTWNNSGTQTLTGNNEVIVTITNGSGGAGDTLSVSVPSACGTPFKLGTIALGADYVNATTTYSGGGSHKSTISLTASGLLTIALGGPSSTSSGNVIPSPGNPVYTPATGLTDLTGNALPTTPVTGTGSQF
jgi:hypothetical protein